MTQEQKIKLMDDIRAYFNGDFNISFKVDDFTAILESFDPDYTFLLVKKGGKTVFADAIERITLISDADETINQHWDGTSAERLAYDLAVERVRWAHDEDLF